MDAASRSVATKLGIVAASVVLGVLAPLSGSASTKGRRLTRDEIARVWVGVSEDDLYLVRLDLSSAGAKLGLAFLNEEPQIVEIKNWKYDGTHVDLTLGEGTGKPSGLIGVGGRVQGTRIRLTLKGSNWSRTADLKAEEDFKKRWDRLRTAMGS